MTLALADRSARLIGLSSAIGAFVLFLVAGQMVGWGDGQLVLLVTLDHLAAFVVLAALAGLNGALQAYALRLRLDRGGQAGSWAGIIMAFVGASCCTPLLWPAALSLLGVSGVALLSINAALHRWFWILASLAAIVLLASTGRAITVITTPCSLLDPRRQPAEKASR